ncbi:MAG: outer membrane protein assembly factor BamD [Candidatus Omnitrophota bacterium]
MRNSFKYIIFISILLLNPRPAFSSWIWTPETNRWVNPKYSVKDTPKEQLEYALGFFAAQDYKQASDELNKLIKYYPRAREAPEAQFYLGLILEEQGQFYKAFKSYQLIIEKYPFSERSADIVKRQYEIGNKLMEGGGRNKFVNMIVGGDYDVVEIFRMVIKNAPYGALAASAQYKIGLYLQGKEMFQEARDEFEKTINDYPDSDWAKAAKYQIAISDAKRSTDPQYDQQITKTAVQELKNFVKEYPDAELSGQAQAQIDSLREKEAENNFLIARFYEKQKNYESAKIYYGVIVKDYQNTSWSAKALGKIQEINAKISSKK